MLRRSGRRCVKPVSRVTGTTIEVPVGIGFSMDVFWIGVVFLFGLVWVVVCSLNAGELGRFACLKFAPNAPAESSSSIPSDPIMAYETDLTLYDGSMRHNATMVRRTYTYTKQ